VEFTGLNPSGYFFHPFGGIVNQVQIWWKMKVKMSVSRRVEVYLKKAVMIIEA
jgi:hypothetical protein